MQLWSELAAAAESGWDFSSRWLAGRGLGSIATSTVVPVDLNAILYHAEMHLSAMHASLGNTIAATSFGTAAKERAV